MMLGGFSASDSAAEFLLLSRNSLPPCGFPILRRHVSVSAPRREKPRIVAARSALNDGVVFDKEFAFTPSFSEYLKAMEFLKNEKYQTLKSSDGGDVSSSNRPRGRKVVKKIEEKSGGELSAAEENSRKGKRGASYRRDSREGDFHDSEMTGRRQGRGRDLGIRNRKMTDGGESESLSVERDAFKPLENGEGVVGGPRVTRVDMEERIQKLAKCLNGADIDIPEWKFSEIMRSAQIRFSDHSILRVVQILGKLGNWKRVLQLIEWLQSRDRFKCHRPRYFIHNHGLSHIKAHCDRICSFV